jgi:hypothetical protein
MFRAPTLIAAAIVLAFAAGLLFLVVRGGCEVAGAPTAKDPPRIRSARGSNVSGVMVRTRRGRWRAERAISLAN